MGGTRCSFQFCKNTSASKPSLHFFHYPVRNQERCELWIRNSDKEEFLKMPLAKLRNRVVCQDHFTEDSFMNCKQISLTKSAVPTLWKSYSSEDQDEAVPRTEPGIQPKKDKPKIINGSLPIPGSSRSNVDDILTDFAEDIEEEQMELERTEPAPIITNQKALHDCLALTMQLNEKLKELDKKVDERIKDYPSRSSSTNPQQSKLKLFASIKRHINPTMATLLFMEMFASADHEWQAEEKELAIELHSLGVPVYEHFRDQFRIRLPAIAEVIKWKEEERHSP